VKNFTLSLYAFHLCQTFDNALDEVDDDASLLWENLVKLGDEGLPFHELKNLRSHLQCYTDNIYKQAQYERIKYKLTHRDNVELGDISTAAGFQIHANLQAFRLHDTYAADLTLYPNDTQDIEIDQLQLFQPKSLLPDVIQASLGQTLWLYGKVNATENECEELAEKFAIALLAGTSLNPKLENVGHLLGGLLFEFQAIHPNYPEDSTQDCHIFIWLNYQQSPIIELFNKSYDWLLEILCRYHKIRLITSQVSQEYRDARTLYSQLQENINHSSQLIVSNDRQTRLDSLKSDLKKLPKYTLEYSQCLGNMQALSTTLETNIKNYNICLKNLAEIGEIPEFWHDFIQKSCDRDLLQIQTHLTYLSPTQASLQQSIDTIRGLVEVEQAEIDRSNENAAQNRQQRLEVVITLMSTGLAVSSISSSVANETVMTAFSQLSICPSTPKSELSQQSLCSFSLILFHLLLGIILAIPMGILVWNWQKNYVKKR
jgi:hypothetical protein